MNEIFKHAHAWEETLLEGYLAYLKWVASSVEVLSGIARSMPECEHLFVAPFFMHIIEGVKEKHGVGCFAQDLYEYVYCVERGVPCLGMWEWEKMLLDAYFNDDDEKLEEVIASIAGTLKTLKPKIIVTKNDVLFLERAIVLAARRCSIPTAVLQHGIFARNRKIASWGGAWADHAITWGDYFTDHYIQTGVKRPGEVHTLGYPRNLKYAKYTGPFKSACLLGYVSDDTAEHVRKACKKTKLWLEYRPHPDELPGRKRKRIAMALPSDGLGDAILRHDIFITDDSTALIEAAIAGRIALQALPGGKPSDNMQLVAGLWTVPDTTRHITRFLRGVKRGVYGYRPVDEYYIQPVEDVAQRFLEIAEAILEPNNDTK